MSQRLLGLVMLFAALVVALAATPQASSLDLPGVPAVSATSPVAGAIDVARAVHPKVTFTLPVDAGTVNEKSFTLTGPAGAVPASVSYDQLSNSAELTPSALLEPGTTYTARVGTDVTSPTGDALAEAVASTFTVLPPPAVLTRDPAPGATGVDHFMRSSVTFTRPMDPASINRSTFTIAKPGEPALLANVAYSPITGVATLVPLYPLEYSKTYVLTLAKGIQAVDGAPLAEAPVSWEFTTSGTGYVRRLESGGAAYATLADVTYGAQGSCVASTTPAGARFDPEGSFVKGGFPRVSANPIAGTNDDLLYQTERYGLWSYVFNVPNGTYMVRTHHAETLKTGAGQRVFGIDVIETAGVDAPSIDLYSLAGPNAAYTRCFSVTTTTGRIQVRPIAVAGDPQISAIEVVPQSPTVTSTTPAANATGVKSSTVTATFSRAMDASSITTSTFQLRDPNGSIVPATVSYDPATRVATLNPSAPAPLAARTTYSASISQTVRASDGMCPSAGFSWSFTMR